MFENKMWNETTPKEQVERALAHQLLSVAAIVNNEIVGIARLDGDTAINFYVNDVFVLPEYQGNGIGSSMVERLVGYAKDISIPGTTIYITLFSSKGKEGFYDKLGFVQRPNMTNGAGMEMTISVPKPTIKV